MKNGVSLHGGSRDRRRVEIVTPLQSESTREVPRLIAHVWTAQGSNPCHPNLQHQVRANARHVSGECASSLPETTSDHDAET